MCVGFYKAEAEAEAKMSGRADDEKASYMANITPKEWRPVEPEFPFTPVATDHLRDVTAREAACGAFQATHCRQVGGRLRRREQGQKARHSAPD